MGDLSYCSSLLAAVSSLSLYLPSQLVDASSPSTTFIRRISLQHSALENSHGSSFRNWSQSDNCNLRLTSIAIAPNQSFVLFVSLLVAAFAYRSSKHSENEVLLYVYLPVTFIIFCFCSASNN
ncbi:hypothetical protein OWV82_020217 [Melia azedarach]|uniref:Uncharacterized protein n=1 Tax=Melia azedarach TaxID=155640 RepID=A0ACC1X562_MELAZ|nr:hypothetical protein OWV82_020217 [Melia azedarach]